MSRRRRRWALVLAAVCAAAGLAVWDRPGRRARPPAYTDLHTALAHTRAHGWELAVPPRRGGPYRLLPGGGVLGPTPEAGMGGRIRDRGGAVVEEVTLRGVEGQDQTIAYLETPGGQQTMAVLVRVR